MSKTQRGSTILQYLTVRPDVSFSDPATPDGKLWNSALKPVTQSHGWSQLHWGPRLASEDMVDLLVTWKSPADLQHFMTHNYQPYLTAIESLLPLQCRDSHAIPSPFIMQLHPGMPTLELDAVSSLYELSFEPPPDEELKTGLAIETQLCRNFLLDAAQVISDGDSFLGMDAVWLEQYEPAALSTEPQEHKQTLLLIIEYTSQTAETALLSRDTTMKESRGDDDGPVLTTTTGDYLEKNLLSKASAGVKHHRVVFENVSAGNVEWLDKGEKWSRYVKRLIDEEGERREGGGGGVGSVVLMKEGKATGMIATPCKKYVIVKQSLQRRRKQPRQQPSKRTCVMGIANAASAALEVCTAGGSALA